jgi:hypothetical protein
VYYVTNDKVCVSLYKNKRLYYFKRYLKAKSFFFHTSNQKPNSTCQEFFFPLFSLFFYYFFIFIFSILQVQTTNLSKTQRQQQQIYQNMQQDEALSILNDFNEILQSEVYVDLERLRILARHGIPNELRGVGYIYFF